MLIMVSMIIWEIQMNRNPYPLNSGQVNISFISYPLPLKNLADLQQILEIKKLCFHRKSQMLKI